ncbi:NADH:flavin oxidoreductase/NADH oxidase [Sphingobacterium gobiense]|uniref:Oxidoreductase n=1 Tax=Sphingobacterium gobiense TaxID=1382456 RepID=A0A2S9JS11_9SPHI|nr:NADH:flavin oxidoreductase/NADH oxidase [Sphingobacterium gobiense]PRD56087.1 oxidoreductase [Sphingobacterium gobiense]
MAKLFSPLSIKGVTLKNRIVVSPMCQYSAVDGFANDWHLVHLGSFAVGGAALILIEATGVSPEARISVSDLGLWKDEQIEKLAQINAFVKQQGAVPGIQLAHAGRKASTMVPWEGRDEVKPENGGWQTVAPSAIPYAGNYPKPLALDAEGIQKVIADFTAAAERALKAGFEVIEIHASHGYLLHQFLSPLSNHRSDAYGGSFENRIRLLLEVLDGVQSVLPREKPLFVRMPGSDWAAGGWTPDDASALAQILKDRSVDVMDVTSGGVVSHQKIAVGPAYQTPFAAKVKRETGALTSTAGLITNAVQAESILVNEEADLIMVAREFLRDPHFPLRAARDLKVHIDWPVQYERAQW